MSAKRQLCVDCDLMQANARQTAFNYKQGEIFFKRVHDPKKLDIRREGPYPIKRVHVNGNVTIALKPGVLERINICRVKPYREQTLPKRVTRAALRILLTEGKNDVKSGES